MSALQIETSYVKDTLERYERSKILEVYFARIDGRTPDLVSYDLQPLYEINLSEIRSFLLGQYPQDSLLMRIFKLMH